MTRRKSKEPSELRSEAPVCIVGDQHWVGLNFEWLHPPFCWSQIDALLGSGTLRAEHGRESQRLKAESHSNKPHFISPSSPPVLGSLFPLDVCCNAIFFNCISSLPLYFFSSAHDRAFLSFCTSQKTFFLWTSVSAWLFSISCFYSPACFSLIFLFSAHVRWGHFLSPASSVSGTGGAPVCNCVSALHVCLKVASQFGSIQNNIQQPSRFIRRSVVRGSTPVPAHFPSHSPIFAPFHTWSNACHGNRKKQNSLDWNSCVLKTEFYFFFGKTDILTLMARNQTKIVQVVVVVLVIAITVLLQIYLKCITSLVLLGQVKKMFKRFEKCVLFHYFEHYNLQCGYGSMVSSGGKNFIPTYFQYKFRSKHRKKLEIK